MNRLKSLFFYQWLQRDPLTGLGNRKELFKDLNSALRRSNRVAVILADVDQLKNVNDAHGNQFEDTTLDILAKVMAARCSTTGALGPYRHGGGTFACLVTDEVDNSREVAELLRADVEHLRFDSHPELKVTIRLAIAVAPADGKTADELWGKVCGVAYSHPRTRNQVA